MFNFDLMRKLDELNLDEKELKSEFNMMKRLMKDITPVEDERVSEIVDEMKKVCFKIEDAIETYAVDVASKRNRGMLARVAAITGCIGDLFIRRKLESDLSIFKEQIHDLNGKLELFCVNETLNQEDNVDMLSFHNRFVGIEENKRTLESLFHSEEFHVISICGMNGIGKTTLARQVYMDDGIRRQFDSFAWVNVSQDFRMRFLLEDVLLQIDPSTKEEVVSSMDFELAQKLCESLQSKRYLIVLDDIWSMSVWDNLKTCFPTGKSASRIVITTRIGNLAKRNADVVSFQMKTLSQDDSWQLFLKKQSLEFKSNQALEEIGKDIVKKCHGLPLAICVVGGLLSRKHTTSHWLSVLKNLDRPYDQKVFPNSSIPKALHLSYDYLPYHIQNCFLYCSLFQRDVEIEVEKLTNLWIAEGFVSSDNGEDETTLSDIAESYLHELVMRNLIFVEEEHITRVRSYRIHDLLREMCLLKGKEENILEVLDLKCGNAYLSMATARRLPVYLNAQEAGYDIFFKHIVSREIRSLLFMNPYPHRQSSFLPHSFSFKKLKLLRVLDFDAFSFQGTTFLKGIKHLSNLRYLSLKNCYLKELPSSIGDLSSLLILDLRVCGGFQVTLPNVLCKLENLTHLYLPFSYRVHADDKLRLNNHRFLERLENFDSSRCDSNDLLNLYNLQCLVAVTEGSLEDLEVIVKCMSIALDNLRESSLDLRNFDCYSKKRISAFEKVLAIRTLNSLHFDGHLGRLPELISQSLTEIFFTACEFTEDPMARLEKLPKLRKLVLYDGAFIGNQMFCSASGFPCLRCLKLSTLQKLERWTIEEGALSKLSTLTLERCQNLDALPDGLVYLRSLQILDISKMPDSFTYRHLKEGKDYNKIQHIPEINFGSSRRFSGLPGRIVKP